MKVELYYFASCPSYKQALEYLREGLRLEGLCEDVAMIPVDTADAAEAKRFIGSPTIRIDGVDIEGPEADEQGCGYRCRIYANNGTIAGWPTVAKIRQAFQSAKGQKRAGPEKVQSTSPKVRIS